MTRSPKAPRARLQEAPRLGRIQIADGRSGEEAEPRQRRHLGRQRRDIHEVGRHGAYQQIRPPLGAAARASARAAAPRHRSAHRRGTPTSRSRNSAFVSSLAPYSTSTAGPCTMRGHARRDVGQQGELGARQVVFRQLGDAAEQAAAFLVVEQLRRQRLPRLQQAGQRRIRDTAGRQHHGGVIRHRCGFPVRCRAPDERH